MLLCPHVKELEILDHKTYVSLIWNVLTVVGFGSEYLQRSIFLFLFFYSPFKEKASLCDFNVALRPIT